MWFIIGVVLGVVLCLSVMTYFNIEFINLLYTKYEKDRVPIEFLKVYEDAFGEKIKRKKG